MNLLRSSLLLFWFEFTKSVKGRDRLVMIVELKVQYCREKLQDSFDTNQTFLRCTIFLIRASFVICHHLFQSAEETFFFTFLKYHDSWTNRVINTILESRNQLHVFKHIEKNNELISWKLSNSNLVFKYRRFMPILSARVSCWQSELNLFTLAQWRFFYSN